MENPSEWPEAERAFHLAYLDDPSQISRRPVNVSWVTLHRRGSLVGLAVSMWRLALGRYEGTEVTVTDAETGEAMRFSVQADLGPQRQRGSTSGVLLGEIGMNAVCCVELNGGVIWPAANPVRLGVRH